MAKEPSAPNTWYALLEAGTATLPWRTEESGVRVLGQQFEPAEAVETEQLPLAPQTLPSLPPAPLPTAAPSAEKLYGTWVHAVLQGVPFHAPLTLRARAEAEAEAVRKAHGWLWAKGSRAEVDVVLEGGALGRMDRLVPHEGAWWIIDFKTGTPTPEVTAQYRAQLAAYARALAQSYPGTPIRTALVWTATAQLIETTA